jgi:hypothetical protein
VRARFGRVRRSSRRVIRGFAGTEIMLQSTVDPLAEYAPPASSRFTRDLPEEPERLAEIQSVLGYGTTSSAALNSIELELTGLRGGRRLGRVEGLAPMDLLGEFRGPVPVGELVTIRLRTPRMRTHVDTFGFIHWQQSVTGRWLAGVFLREKLPDDLLQHVWMDMRRELRFPTRLRLHATFGGRMEYHDAVVCDYSRSGVRLQTTDFVCTGQPVELFDGDLLAAGVVRYTKPGSRPGTAYVGCEFADNEGVRIARVAVLNGDEPPGGWKMAEQWTRPAARK